MSFWKDVFSDSGQPSASRVLTLIHSFGSLGLMANYSYHNHGSIPDPATITVLAGFATVHYAVNRTTAAWENAKVANASNGAAKPTT